MKTKFLFLGLVVSILLCGCNISEKTTEDVLPKKEFKTIPIEKALESLDAVLAEIDVDTKSGKRSVRSVETLKSSDLSVETKSSSGLQIENLAYLVNFENNRGYAVLAANEIVPDDVVAIIDEGEISLQDFLQEHRSDIYDGIDLYCEEEDDYYVGNSSVSSLQFMKDYFTTCTEPKIDFGLDDDFSITFPPGGEYVYTPTKVGPLLKTTNWHQDPPFNNRARVTDEATGLRAAAGCVAIALSQILICNGISGTFTYDPIFFGKESMYCDSHTMQGSASVIVANPVKSAMVAHFVRYVGWTCDTWYFSNMAAFSTATRAKKALKDEFSFRYKNVKKYNSYREDVILDMLRKNKPVFILAFSGHVEYYGWSDPGGAHAWVIDGYIKKDGKYLLHCDWGDFGRANGYYTSGVFNRVAGPVDREPGRDDDSGTGSASYGWWYRIISYDLK